MGQVHGEIYEKMKAEIAYVVERDPAKAQAFSERFSCRISDSFEKLSEQEIDAADICLPTNLHLEAIRTAAKKCRAIFCEKPICLNAEEYLQLKKIGDEGTCAIMVGQVLRFWNGYVKSKELVEEGAVGIPRMVNCLRRQKMPDWSKGNWLMDPEKSGGLLMDLSIHDIDYLYWLFGKPQKVYSQVVRNERTTVHNIMMISYKECCANVIGSWGMPEAFGDGELEASLEIIGDQGMITYKGGDWLEVIQGNKNETIKLEHTDGYEEELRYFVRSVEEGRYPQRADLYSVEGTMDILWAAQESSGKGQAVTII